MLAAREKTLISHAMDTLSRRVAENGSGGNGSDMSEPEDDAMELGIVDGLVIAEHLTNFHLATPTHMGTYAFAFEYPFYMRNSFKITIFIRSLGAIYSSLCATQL